MEVMGMSFWKGKTVLITGHTGFKGSWLSIWLARLGVYTIGFSKDIPTNPSLFESAIVAKNMTKSITDLDVRDYQSLENVIKDFKPQIVIHMAAQAILRESYYNPVETYSTNVMGTVNLLEAIRKKGHDVRVILNVTSDKCYDPKPFQGKKIAYTENDSMGGYDPYSNSKACSELVTASFRDSFFHVDDFDKHHTALASVRAGNVIGGGDWGQNRLLPDIMRGYLQNSVVKIRNPNAIRPWQFVLEPLSCYIKLIELLWDNGPKYSKGWNVGPTKDNLEPVRWIVDELNCMLDGRIKTEYEIKPSRLHEEDYLDLDCSMATSEIGWHTKLNLKKALKWTCDWYKAYNEKKDMSEFSISQIERFMSL